MIATVLASVAIAAGTTHVTLNPAVVPLDHTATVTVTGIDAPTLQVHLLGSSERLGKAVPWTPLHRVGKTWQATLPAPEFRGIYPIELRVARGSAILRSDTWLLRVFAKGTLSLPSFKTPEEVARYWVRLVTGTGRLEALRHWPRPAFDRRVRKLHELMVIAYSTPSARSVKDRLGIFVTAVRDGYHGRWRLLEATETP
ncbi:MAG TPA: hypothetical protein VMJ49_03565 [Gaiellaceae bacterium]|nr:hypothetical protein [Gaiellaceae bacterium]